ncbi:MAG: hypothetical protein IKI29_06160 [Clostridia bacterium]|nr:hypothetical protein [Clostridia bacterium]
MKKKKQLDTAKVTDAVHSQPETAFELINKYGTYEIQPTAESDSEYPAIAQGLPKTKKKGRE